MSLTFTDRSGEVVRKTFHQPQPGDAGALFIERTQLRWSQIRLEEAARELSAEYVIDVLDLIAEGVNSNA